MVTSPAPQLAHIAGDASWSATYTLLVVAGAIITLALVAEHLYVKQGHLRWHRMRTPVATVVALALASVIAPVPGFAQTSTEPIGLPDLISDPPYVWFIKDLDLGNGDPARVLAFDGYLHNIGDGRLDLFGNPQVPGGVKQRVFDGEEWQVVGAPTVRFETNDGHRHFHLIGAVDYALWDEGQTQRIGDASKVGFCLLDTEQIEPTPETFYNIADINYCGLDSPEATTLSMGISPGWRDTYDAATTLQWVDVSNVRPGRYWVSAKTDPNNEIAESNEDNNAEVFSANKFAVPGYVARSISVEYSGDPIELRSQAYGTVGPRVFSITQGPTHGSLNVPVGFDLHDSLIEYVPQAGFVGTDVVSYLARDSTSRFPFEPTIVELTIEVREPGPDASIANSTIVQIPEVESRTVQLFAPVEESVRDDQNADASWFAHGLPPGLRLDQGSGAISGVPTTTGEFTSTLLTNFVDGTAHERIIEWTVEDPGQPTLQLVNNFSTTSTDLLRMHLGTGDSDARYEGSNLPAGTLVVENVPLLTGTPEEIGDFEIEVREIIDDEVVSSITFTWTVRPSVHPRFPL